MEAPSRDVDAPCGWRARQAIRRYRDARMRPQSCAEHYDGLRALAQRRTQTRDGREGSPTRVGRPTSPPPRGRDEALRCPGAAGRIPQRAPPRCRRGARYRSPASRRRSTTPSACAAVRPAASPSRRRTRTGRLRRRARLRGSRLRDAPRERPSQRASSRARLARCGVEVAARDRACAAASTSWPSSGAIRSRASRSSCASCVRSAVSSRSAAAAIELARERSQRFAVCFAVAASVSRSRWQTAKSRRSVSTSGTSVLNLPAISSRSILISLNSAPSVSPGAWRRGLLQGSFLDVARCMRLACDLDLPDELVAIWRRAVDLHLLVVRGEARVIDLLGETGDRRALVYKLLLQAGDMVAQLALGGADPGRADRHDLGLHRLADAGRSARVKAKLVGAGTQRRLDLVACFVRGTGRRRGPRAPRMLRRIVSTSAARSPRPASPPVPARATGGHRGRQSGARRVRERCHCCLRILPGRQLGDLGVTRVEHHIEPRRETFTGRALRASVMLPLEIGPDQIVGALRWAGLGLSGNTASSHTRAACRRRRRAAHRSDRRPWHVARIALGVDQVLEPQRKRFLRRELVAAGERRGNLHRPAHHEHGGWCKAGRDDDVAPEQEQPAKTRVLEHRQARVAELGGDDFDGLAPQRFDGRLRQPVAGQSQHAVPARAHPASGAHRSAARPARDSQ